MEEKRRYIINGERVSHDEYVKTKYEDLRVRVPRGKKEEIQTHTQERGESLNGFINRAINETIERDMAGGSLHSQTQDESRETP